MMIVKISAPISVTIGPQLKRIGMLEQTTMVKSANKVVKNLLDSSLVRLKRGRHKLANFVNRKDNIEMCNHGILKGTRPSDKWKHYRIQGSLPWTAFRHKHRHGDRLSLMHFDPM